MLYILLLVRTKLVTLGGMFDMCSVPCKSRRHRPQFAWPTFRLGYFTACSTLHTHTKNNIQLTLYKVLETVRGTVCFYSLYCIQIQLDCTNVNPDSQPPSEAKSHPALAY
jgi:hypothetical protein